jgi:hypothetical protein
MQSIGRFGLNGVIIALIVSGLTGRAAAQVLTSYQLQIYQPGVDPETGMPFQTQEIPAAAVVCNQPPSSNSGRVVDPNTVAWDDPVHPGHVCSVNEQAFFLALPAPSGAGDYLATVTATDGNGLTSPRSAPSNPFNVSAVKHTLILENVVTRQAAVWYMGGADGSQLIGSSWLGDTGEMGSLGWSIVGTGDFNGDGKLDVVWQNDSTRQVSVWYMGGALGNVFLGWSWLGDPGKAGVPGWRVVGIGDFNKDGHPDLVWQNDSTRQVNVWYMGGALGNVFLDWTWLGDPGKAGVPGWRVAGIGDFNNDGYPDLVWQNDSTRQVSVWYMGGALGNVFLGWNWLGDPGEAGVPGWSVVGTGDFNNDGHPDLIWQNDSTAQVSVWYMTGSQGNEFLGSNWLSQAGVPGWRVIDR